MISTTTILKVSGGKWLVKPAEETEIKGAAFDTREITDQQIFFTFKSETADGHDFLGNLEGSTVKVAVVDRKLDTYPKGVAILLVSSVLTSLHTLAGHIHSKFSGKTIAITGSAGKTTSKHWIGQALGTKMIVLYSKGSFNNHIGCPITIFDLEPHHQVLILEMGANGLGEIDALSKIFPPDIGVILNVGYAHVGKFGSLENTYTAKTELVKHIKRNGAILIPNNDVKLANIIWNITKNHSIRIIKIPEHFIVRMDLENEVIFRIKLNNKDFDVRTRALGPNLEFILDLILVIGRLLGLNTEKLVNTLFNLKPIPGRLEILQGVKDTVIINDSYNANPEAVSKLCEIISKRSETNKAIVLGNISELGEEYETYAKIIAKGVLDPSIKFYINGENTTEIFKMLKDLVPNSIEEFDDQKNLDKFIEPLCGPGTVVGFKGSRSAGVEKYMKKFIKQPG